MVKTLDSGTPSTAISTRVGWKDSLWLCVPLIIYIVLRLPALLHQPGGQDEQFFAVPGWTVLNEGIPRIPYLPTTNRASFFAYADQCVMAIPPGLFYVQAPFFAIFPPGYPTARLPSFLGALGIIGMTYLFARQIGARHLWALMVACLIAVSRALLFTGIIARPDVLCILSGVLAMFILFRSRDWNQFGLPLASGALCGLAALFHPLALVFAMQGSVALALARGSLLARVRRTAWFTAASIAVLGLWTPLILSFPREFTSQFFANVFDRAGPGIFARLLWPFPSLQHHAKCLLELAGGWQCGLMTAALLGGSWLAIRNPVDSRLRAMMLLTWSSIFLTATVVGIHPTLGYWLYPTVLICVFIAAALESCRWPRYKVATVWLLSLLLCLPGAGLKTAWVYIMHFGSRDYHAKKFIQHTLRDLPADGLYLVDLSYAFDVYLSGRKTLLCGDKEVYWGADEMEYRYLLIAWEGKDSRAPQAYAAKNGKLYGSKSEPQTCYVEVFERSRK